MHFIFIHMHLSLLCTWRRVFNTMQ
jgi:hypothetical protein